MTARIFCIDNLKLDLNSNINLSGLNKLQGIINGKGNIHSKIKISIDDNNNLQISLNKIFEKSDIRFKIPTTEYTLGINGINGKMPIDLVFKISEVKKLIKSENGRKRTLKGNLKDYLAIQKQVKEASSDSLRLLKSNSIRSSISKSPISINALSL